MCRGGAVVLCSCAGSWVDNTYNALRLLSLVQVIGAVSEDGFPAACFAGDDGR
jgi:hypothetical protein